MANKIQQRLHKISTYLKEHDIDTIMVLIEENRRYLSGFTGEDTQFDESAGALFITDSHLVLATDSRYELQAKEEAPDYEILCYAKGLIDALPDMLAKLKTSRLAFEKVRLSYAQYEKIIEKLEESKLSIEIIPSEDIVESHRLIKDEDEIQALKKALSTAESVFVKIRETLCEGMTEKEAAWQMEKGMREAGAEALSFPVIVASGPNSALPHAVPRNRSFRREEPILFDWGARMDGYCSDISRTIVLGSPDDVYKKVYDTVRNAQLKAIEAIKPGKHTKNIDQIARNFIDHSEFKGKFGHGLGHGTGLAIHENPRLSPIKDSLIEPGMVFTVEPGIYLPGWGGVRLENMVVVRDEGAEVLNRLDTEMMQL